MSKSRKTGGKVRGSVEDRFWIKVLKPDSNSTTDCWLWLATKNNKGYGQFWIGPTMKDFCVAHRFSYEALHGPIPDGLTLDHLCRNRSCVNPDHLEPVTNRENILRGNGPTALKARQMECKYGHPFTIVNTYFRPEGGRKCRTCMRTERARI